MKTDSTKLLQDIGAFLLAAPKTPATLRRSIQMVVAERKYRWIGVYKIERGDFVLAASTGDETPTYRRFPVTQGLCGAVAESRETLIVADVHKDARWLPAFWSTQSEIVVPILCEKDNHVLGAIAVESDRLDAFGEDDRDFLEHVAVLLGKKLCTAKKSAPAKKLHASAY